MIREVGNLFFSEVEYDLAGQCSAMMFIVCLYIRNTLFAFVAVNFSYPSLEDPSALPAPSLSIPVKPTASPSKQIEAFPVQEASAAQLPDTTEVEEIKSVTLGKIEEPVAVTETPEPAPQIPLSDSAKPIPLVSIAKDYL